MGQVYTEGKSTNTSGLPVVAPKSVQAGSEYIWEYWCPKVTFAVITPAELSGFIHGLLNLSETIKKVAPGSNSPPVKITGVMIDTDTGNIWIRGVIQPVPGVEYQQAGVNPLAIGIMIGSIFALIGAAVSLRYVYEVFFDPYDPPGGNPCTAAKSDAITNTANYFRCIARESRWFLTGLLVGVVGVTIFLLVKFGPRVGTK